MTSNTLFKKVRFAIQWNLARICITTNVSNKLLDDKQSNIVNSCEERMLLKAVTCIQASLCSTVGRFLPIIAYSFGKVIGQNGSKFGLWRLDVGSASLRSKVIPENFIKDQVNLFAILLLKFHSRCLHDKFKLNHLWKKNNIHSQLFNTIVCKI